jgi:two-component system chemotaxis response regulator CheY
MTVVDFVRIVGANDKKPQVIICLTALDIGAITRAHRADAQGCLVQPFNRSKLLQSLRQGFGVTRLRFSRTAA